MKELYIQVFLGLESKLIDLQTKQHVLQNTDTHTHTYIAMSPGVLLLLFLLYVL